jgi:hypothetical protein
MKGKQVNEAQTNGADASAPTETIPWDEAVTEGKALVARIKAAESDQLRLGELAHKVVHPKYRDRTFAKYAEKLGIESNTLAHYRTVYRAYANILPPAAKLPSFEVLKVLAAHPDRAELIKAEPKMSKRRAEVHRVLKDHAHRGEILSENPGLSCTRKARELMAEHDAGDANGAGNGKGADRDERWLRNVLIRANDDIDEAAFVDEPMTPAQLCDLLNVIEPDALAPMLQASVAWRKAYDFLIGLCEDPPQTVCEERDRRAKANAAAANLKDRTRRAPTAQAALAVQVGA